MIIPNISDPFFHPIVRGAEDTLLREGYTLVLGNSDNDLKKEELYYDTFRLKQVDGILAIVSPCERAPEYLLQHDSGVCPIVYVDRYHRDLQGDTVLLDDAGTSRRAVNHLFKLGHRQIAIITGPLLLNNARRRLEGYKRALTENKIGIEGRLIHEGAFDRASGYTLTKTILSLKPRPTAILASNALMAVGALHAFSDLGVSCPDEIALVSHNDSELFDLVRPPVTAFRQPVYELGASGAEILVERLRDGMDATFRRVVLKPEFVVRKSCGSALSGNGPCGETNEAPASRD